ncbi:MAG: molybdopterin molybdotransferase MoeA [Firmicutes bacterium]|uniref:Molybdopterin molybdenumtransferase n=1 Tax=Sulfobacillus benefaciens TaxID=453960 RepID=A0A2T2WRW9_9FIRM|nr:molybdopterin molybdotransferase MoeA [Bacillota bacterium]MCL5014338.1 molybdopterin molybdotransferase MoeA [Bacillota bacterium]PSR24943.1 MAG: molybdopterin molybdochelatase [Sulfobacillus benefaciens]
MLMTVEEAQERILSHPFPKMSTERLPLLQAWGRVLAEDIVSPEDVPGFTNSSMDGYAVLASDVQQATSDHPVALRIKGTIAAGHPSPDSVKHGEAYKIMTGAPLPAGADAVIQSEWTRRSEDNWVLALSPVKPGQNVRRQGQDIHRGDKVLEAGLVVKAPIVGILATIAREDVLVYRKPRVAIVATGDELIEPGEKLELGKIRNSNSYALAAAALAAGADPVILPPAPDTKEAISQRFSQASTADIILSSGGVSVGDFDWVKNVLSEEGSLDLWRVNMKPGKPVTFGTLHNRPFFGLPGNPVSALVTFELFVRPVIRVMLSVHRWQRTILTLPLYEPFLEIHDRRHYVRSRLVQEGEKLYVWPYKKQDSAIQTSWIGAEALMVVPENSGPYKAGDLLPVMLIPADV